MVALRQAVKAADKPRRPFLRDVIASPDSVKLCNKLGDWKKAVSAAPRKRGEPGRLSPRARDVANELAALFSQAKGDGLAWPTHRELADRLCVHHDTIRIAMKELREGGYLLAMELRKKCHQNVYALALPNVDGFFLGYEDEDTAIAETRHTWPGKHGIGGRKNTASHMSKGTESGTESKGKGEGVGLRPEDSPSHPFYSASAREDTSDNVVDLDARRPRSGTPFTSWPYPAKCADDPTLGVLIPPGSDADFAKELALCLVQYGSREILAAIGYDLDHDRPDHTWLPESVWESIELTRHVGLLERRGLLDELAPPLANGELRASFDRARRVKWEARTVEQSEEDERLYEETLMDLANSIEF